VVPVRFVRKEEGGEGEGIMLACTDSALAGFLSPFRSFYFQMRRTLQYSLSMDSELAVGEAANCWHLHLVCSITIRHLSLCGSVRERARGGQRKYT
jgi:hypothetical protein